MMMMTTMMMTGLTTMMIAMKAIALIGKMDIARAERRQGNVRDPDKNCMRRQMDN